MTTHAMMTVAKPPPQTRFSKWIFLAKPSVTPACVTKPKLYDEWEKDCLACIHHQRASKRWTMKDRWRPYWGNAYQRAKMDDPTEDALRDGYKSMNKASQLNTEFNDAYDSDKITWKLTAIRLAMGLDESDMIERLSRTFCESQRAHQMKSA